jgi:lipoprotein LprG
MRTLHARRALGPLALALAVSTLAGCGSHDKPGASPQRTLAAAKRNLDGTSGVRIGLSTPKLPTGVDGLLDADGIGTHAPAFTGAIKVSASGVTADAAVVAVEHTVYAKLPFTSKFVRINPADYGAPDPASLMAPRGGLSSLLTSATHVQEGGKVRAGSAVLTSYTATVPGKAVSAVIPSATSTAGFRATFTVDDRRRLAKAVLTGPFYPRAKDVTYTITFAHYGTTKRIVAP